MGSTSTYRAKGLTNDEWFGTEVVGTQREILASASIKGVWYAAIRESDGEVYAAVVLFHWSRGQFNFTWKSMTEHMGPGAYDCPAKILDLLTATGSESAMEWRAACRAKLARKADQDQLKPGDRIRVHGGLSFNIDRRTVKVQEFIYSPQKRRPTVFRAMVTNTPGLPGLPPYSFLVRLPEWRSYNYELVTS